MMAKIKFMVDESVDFPVVRYLRNIGYNVASIAEDSPSIDDIHILERSFKENRILLVDDKDFGALIFKEKLSSRGLILFRLDDQSSKAKIKALERAIAEYSDKLSGNFIVVSENKIRVRKL